MPTTCQELGQTLMLTITLEGHSEFSSCFFCLSKLSSERLEDCLKPHSLSEMRAETTLDDFLKEPFLLSSLASAVDLCLFSEVVTHIMGLS